MMKMVVLAKNDGLVAMFCVTWPSRMRFSRQVVCSIQRLRSRLVNASTEGCTVARSCAKRA
jgi:hypothetical protein